MDDNNSNSVPHLKGWVEYTLRDDATGEVIREGRADNVFTNWGYRSFFWAGNFGAWVVISDDEHPVGMRDWLNHLKVDGKSPTPVQGPTPSYDLTNLIISRTCSFTSPSSPPRTVRRIALSIGGSINGNAINSIAAYMEITPPIVQNSGSTLELVYRQQFVIPTAKSMQRWVQNPLKNQRRFAQVYMHNPGPANSWSAGFTMWQNHGKAFFVDEGARYGLAQAGNGLGYVGGLDSWAAYTRSGGLTATSVAPHFASRYGAGNITISDTNNNSHTGAFATAFACADDYPWASDDSWSNSRFYPLVGFQPLGTFEGDVSTVFQHPAGETYLFNVTGSVATGQGTVLVKGPFRPDDQYMPVNRSYAIQFYASGGTTGPKASYRVTSGGLARQDGYQSLLDGTVGLNLWYLYPTYSSDIDPDVVYTKNSCCYDGRGHYWATGRSNGTTNRLFMWKGFTFEQVLDRVESDDTRFWGITPGDQLVAQWYGDSSNAYGPPQASPCLCSNEAGLVFYPTRMAAAGQQAVYVIDNQKPGRYYQRPSGIVATGSHNLQVAAADEIHSMFPFVSGTVGSDGVTGGDVGRRIRIVNSANGNNSVRTITAVVDARNVTLDGAAFTTEVGLTWHWVVVTPRTSTNGLTDRLRVLKYDLTRNILWAWTDAGIQASTNNGLTWGAVIGSGTGLATTSAQRCIIPDGRNGNSNCCIGNSGELYWLDDGGGSTAAQGLNKYVPGAGPNYTGGTHTRIFCNTFHSWNASYPPFCLAYDPVAPDMATTEGSLWIGRVFSTSVWNRLKCDLFTQANMTNFTDPNINNSTIASRLNQGVQHITVGPGGAVAFNNNGNNNGYPNINYDYGTHFPAWTGGDNLGLYYYDHYMLWPGGDPSNMGHGCMDVRPDGTLVQFSDPGHSASAAHGGHVYWWEPTSQKWIPWKGTEAQFNTRYGVTNSGRKDVHATYDLFKDNIRFAFIQNGSVAQTSEYVTGERFSFISSLGLHRTNIQDLSWAQDITVGKVTNYLEDQPIKTVPVNGGGGNVRVFQDHANGAFSSKFDPQRPLGSGTNFVPEVVGSTGRRFGWCPQGWVSFLNGQNSGVVPDTYTNTNLPGWTAGIDLGASLVVGKLQVQLFTEPSKMAHYTSTDNNSVGRVLVYYSDDNAVWTEFATTRLIAQATGEGGTCTVGAGIVGEPVITGLANILPNMVGRYMTFSGSANPANDGTFLVTAYLSGTSARVANPAWVAGASNWTWGLDPGYKYVCLESSTASAAQNPSDSPYCRLTIDLAATGLADAARQHRYWKVVNFYRNAEYGSVFSDQFYFGHFVAYGNDGLALGLDVNTRLPEAGSVDLLSSPVRQASFIQDRVGISGKGGINSAPDGYADGFTDLVTIVSGTFNTGSINTTTDYLAYKHPVTGTFLRNDVGSVGNGEPGALGEQTMVRIVAVTTTTIQVAKRNVPSNLSAADWEVRRPANLRTDYAYNAGDMTDCFAGMGYMQFHDADAGREYRVIQRGINRAP
jgi:hypothetical protein